MKLINTLLISTALVLSSASIAQTYNPDGFGGWRGSDGTTARPDGFGGLPVQ